jgi:hypothetical protein
MIVSINQPAYLPWPGYFDRIKKADLHIVLDHVQFEKNSMTNRNKIKTPQGWTWLTVPVKTKGKFKDCPISELEINETVKWTHKHWQGIKSNYSKAPYFRDHENFFKEVYEKDWILLNDILTETNDYFNNQLDIKTECVTSTSLKPEETKSNLILELCRKVSATQYISGPLGRDYLDREAFNKAGIEVLFHDYQYPEYPQQHGDFEPFMSVIDLLFNCGPESAEILQNPPDCLKTE